MENKLTDNKNSIFLIFNWRFKEAYGKSFTRVMKKLKLTKSEIDILLFLHNNAPLNTARDIARYRAMSKSMISKSVDSLYRKDYLSYSVSELDKRQYHLKIQAKAMPIVETLCKVQRKFFKKLFNNITEEEFKTVETVLNKMHENIID